MKATQEYKKAILQGFILGALTIPSSIFAYSGLPSELSEIAHFLLNLTVMLGVMASGMIILSLPVTIVMSYWLQHFRPTIIGSIAFILTFLIAMLCLWGIRNKALIKITENVKPLIQAIEKYNLENGKYPDSSDKIPKFNELNRTGVCAYPFVYFHLPVNSSDFKKYELWIDFQLGMGFDSFIYWPEESYPDKIYGGITQKINGWAYIHE